jgi:hypothetical protein
MKRIVRVLAVCLALTGLAIRAYGNAADSQSHALTGTWQCTSHGGTQGNMQFTLDLEQNGTTVTGSVSSPLGDADISSATFKNNTLRIEIDGGDTKYVLSAKYSGGELAGSWSSSSGEKGTWAGKKASANGQ